MYTHLIRAGKASTSFYLILVKSENHLYVIMLLVSLTIWFMTRKMHDLEERLSVAEAEVVQVT